MKLLMEQKGSSLPRLYQELLMCQNLHKGIKESLYSLQLTSKQNSNKTNKGLLPLVNLLNKQNNDK